MSESFEIQNIINSNKGNNPVFTLINYKNGKKSDIDSNDIVSLFKLYCDNITSTDSKVNLGETVGKSMPVISEFVFKFEHNNKKKNKELDLYNKKLIHSIIYCHHEVFRDLIFISSSETEYNCVVSESKTWKENNNICIKLKFQFPYCRIGVSFLSTVFRSKLVTKLRAKNVQKHFLHSTPIGDWTDHLEQIKESYPLYGSSENDKILPLYFVGVYGPSEEDNCINIPLENTYKYDQHNFFTTKNCIVEEMTVLEEDMEPGTYDFALYLLPIFLSLHFNVIPARVKENKYEDNDLDSSTTTDKDQEERELNPSDFEICLELVNYLADKRFNQETYFLDIGKAFYHATEGGDHGLKAWIRMAEERSENYDEDFCRLNYEGFGGENITVKTIAWYARSDDDEKYRQWHENWCLPKLTEALDRQQVHVLVAEAFYRVFWLEYMYTGKKWTEFRKSRLVILKEDIPIRRTITDKFIPYFEHLRAQYSVEKLKLSSHTSSGSNKKMAQDLEENIKEIGKMIKKLLTDNYRAALVRSIREYFWKEDLVKVLDKNPKLLGVRNCVIELTDTKAFVRSGKPEDYITKKVGVSYRSEYSFKHQDVKDLLVYFRQVFPNPSLNEHMKKDMAAMLYGRNAEKSFRMWIGDTNGSKSVFQKMLRTMLGDYYCDLPAEFFSAQQRGGSGPNPELAQTEGARAAFSAEPDDDTSFKGARIKKITGGDSFYARGCNEDGGTIETTFKAVMVLNLVPDISGMDEATRNRFTMIPFEGRWLKPDEAEDLPDDLEEQIKLKTYKMDDRFEENIPRLASALLWLAVYYYKKYRAEGLNNPPYIKKWMNDYWKRHDPYIAFISEKLENPKIKVVCEVCKDREIDCKNCNNDKFIEQIDVSKSITASEIYPEFKRWLRETHPQMQQVPKGKFIEILSTKDKLGKQRDRRWWGIAVRRSLVNEIEEM